jgi:hypothetical protein
MKRDELIKLLSEGLLPEERPEDMRERLTAAGVSYSYSEGFTGKVINRIFTQMAVNRQTEFLRSLNNVFYRVAFAGVAAIALLLLSIFFMEGSLSFNSLVGISDTFDENFVSLLTGY